jgi:hypothetical protein
LVLVDLKGTATLTVKDQQVRLVLHLFHLLVEDMVERETPLLLRQREEMADLLEVEEERLVHLDLRRAEKEVLEVLEMALAAEAEEAHLELAVRQ